MIVFGVEQFNANPCVAVTVRVWQAGLTNEPGEPISFASLKALNAPFTPTALNCEMVALFILDALSKVLNVPVGEVPNITLACKIPDTSYKFTASPPVPKPTPEPVYEPTCKPAGGLLPNQVFKNFALVESGVDVSMKITDSPGAILVMPFSATEAANEPELSSIFQPVMSALVALVLVTSNQSAATGLLPLDQGATSVIYNLPIVPGEPISMVSFTALKASFTPTTLNVEIVVLFNPMALLNDGYFGPDGEVPKVTFACNSPLVLNMLTASPPVLKPTPEPE